MDFYDKFMNAGKFLGLIIAVIVFVVIAVNVAKRISYAWFYEDMVIETIHQQVRMDAPIVYQAAVEQFKALCRQLRCEMHYAPTQTDSPPGTVIVTNKDILAEQALAQQILETLVKIGPFTWDKGILRYGEGLGAIQIVADNVIAALCEAGKPTKTKGGN